MWPDAHAEPLGFWIVAESALRALYGVLPEAEAHSLAAGSVCNLR